jgi:hypothetical protein
MFDTVNVFGPVPVSRKRARWEKKLKHYSPHLFAKSTNFYGNRLVCDRYSCQEVSTTVIPASLRTCIYAISIFLTRMAMTNYSPALFPSKEREIQAPCGTSR